MSWPDIYEKASTAAAELVGSNSIEYEAVSEREYERLHAQRVRRVMFTWHCSEDDAERFCALRDEGYSTTQAALMAGIGDPT